MAYSQALTWVMMALAIVFVTLYATKTCPSQASPPLPPIYETYGVSLTEAERGTTQTYNLPSGTQQFNVTFPSVSINAFNPFETINITATTYQGTDVPFNLVATPSVVTNGVNVQGGQFWGSTVSAKENPNYSGGTTTDSYYYTASAGDTFNSISSMTTFSLLFANPFPADRDNSVTVYWNTSD